jgi:hypothetical protein
MMLPESPSTTYDLGHHTLEITQDRTVLITAQPTESETIAEVVQLDSEETYKLFVALHELFQPNGA